MPCMATNNPKKHKVELMAPVGSYESLHAAINAGCDSIFFGITQLNMRAKASQNLNIEDLYKISKICHENNVKAYLTLNTILYDHDITLAHKIIDAVKDSGIDAIIASDMAAIEYANKVGVSVNISTQMSVSNIETVKFFAKYSDVIVLARELTLPMMKRICDEVEKQDIRGRNGKRIEIEVFGHGAMCIAVSGRCSMSLLTDNSSANRGACRQNCRRRYKVIDVDTNTAVQIENDYVMSPSDLCTIGLLDELVATGISILKIEGRGRSADYVDEVIRCYREALDSIEEKTYTQEKIADWNKRLGTVYNRGHSHGFYLGKPIVEWSGAYGNKATKTRIEIGNVLKYYPKINIAEIALTSGSLNSQDEYQITGSTTGIVKGKNPKLKLENNFVDEASIGDVVTFAVESRVRDGDKVYKVQDASPIV